MSSWISKELMSDTAVFMRLYGRPGLLRVLYPDERDCWGITAPGDSNYGTALNCWTTGEFWDGATWRPIAEWRQWEDEQQASRLLHQRRRHTENDMGKVNLGDEAKDLVTGFKGICIARTEWLNGCIRVTLQAKVGKDDKVPDAQTLDEPQLQVTKVGAVRMDSLSGLKVPPARRTGGPIPTPQQHAGPKR